VKITIDIPDDIAASIDDFHDRLDEIIRLGLRRLAATDAVGFDGIDEVIETLASLPSPQDVLALRPSEPLQQRISELSGKAQSNELTNGEKREWDQIEYLEHVVRMAKAQAARKLKSA